MNLTTVVSRIAAVVMAAGIFFPDGAQARSFSCRTDSSGGYSLSVAQTDCPTGRAVQRAFFSAGDGNSPVGTIEVRGRTWRCSSKIVKSYGYDPTIVSDRVTGRVLCRHVTNAGRFVRWFYDGGGD